MLTQWKRYQVRKRGSTLELGWACWSTDRFVPQKKQNQVRDCQWHHYRWQHHYTQNSRAEDHISGVSLHDIPSNTDSSQDHQSGSMLIKMGTCKYNHQQVSTFLFSSFTNTCTLFSMMGLSKIWAFDEKLLHVWSTVPPLPIRLLYESPKTKLLLLILISASSKCNGIQEEGLTLYLYGANKSHGPFCCVAWWVQRWR